MLFWGSSKEEPDQNLRKALEVGIEWNAEKCVFGVTEVSYFGHVLSDKGVPDPKKIAAIQEMKPPRNKQELETLLGMVNYLAKFTLNLAETTAPMRSLLKKDSEFVWDCDEMGCMRCMYGVARSPKQLSTISKALLELHG